MVTSLTLHQQAHEFIISLKLSLVPNQPYARPRRLRPTATCFIGGVITFHSDDRAGIQDPEIESREFQQRKSNPACGSLSNQDGLGQSRESSSGGGGGISAWWGVTQELSTYGSF